jgi:hypothetical protein
MRIPVSAAARWQLGFADTDLHEIELYLYQIDGANVGQFSPTKLVSASTAREILALLSSSDVSLSDTIITAERLPTKELHTARSASLTIDRGKYRVRAESQGESVLLLPIEFSRCFNVVSRLPGEPPVLFRADLFLTGIMFERMLDAELAFRSGPFGASKCRLQDLGDVQQLHIRDAFEDRPEFGMLGRRPKDLSGTMCSQHRKALNTYL